MTTPPLGPQGKVGDDTTQAPKAMTTTTTTTTTQPGPPRLRRPRRPQHALKCRGVTPHSYVGSRYVVMDLLYIVWTNTDGFIKSMTYTGVSIHAQSCCFDFCTPYFLSGMLYYICYTLQ